MGWQLGILNLILAVIWLATALVVLAQDYFGNGIGRTLLGTNVSLGWPLLAMALYNLIRWWRPRSYEAKRKLQERLRPQRRRFDPPTDEPPTPFRDFPSESPPQD